MITTGSWRSNGHLIRSHYSNYISLQETSMTAQYKMLVPKQKIYLDITGRNRKISSITNALKSAASKQQILLVRSTCHQGRMQNSMLMIKTEISTVDMECGIQGTNGFLDVLHLHTKET